MHLLPLPQQKKVKKSYEQQSVSAYYFSNMKMINLTL